MIDPGYIVIAVVVSLVALVIWSWRARHRHVDATGNARTLPGRRLEGSDHIGGGSE